MPVRSLGARAVLRQHAPVDQLPSPRATVQDPPQRGAGSAGPADHQDRGPAAHRLKSSERDLGRFNRWAATYDRHYLQRKVFEPVHKTLLEVAVTEASSAKAILDVGCGTGRLLRSAESLFPNARLEGVDPAPEMVATAT
ncbi:MAG: methyltransferase domain-containing protein [Chloroflexi bacterium]|nr:MAG: methyltransferase domain-containing protein [Chloroflexota bacterium]TMF82958.1 MAG: methyltransferase domain-containing protein [Chloroflexota bacterium]